MSLFNLDFESCLSFRTLFFPVIGTAEAWLAVTLWYPENFYCHACVGKSVSSSLPSDIRTCPQQSVSSKQAYAFLSKGMRFSFFSYLIMQESVSYSYRILFFLKTWSHCVDQAVLLTRRSACLYLPSATNETYSSLRSLFKSL